MPSQKPITFRKRPPTLHYPVFSDLTDEMDKVLLLLPLEILDRIIRTIPLAHVVRCEVERLLGQAMLSSLGNTSTCEWSADGLVAIVSYDEAYDGYLTAPERNITVVSG